jgi:hypothetical protein
MSGLMAHDEHNSYSNVPNTKDGFLYNSQGAELNSLGHRCKEIKKVLGEDLQFPRYFLVLGDNACLHMHKPVEETWPYLLSKAINHQYYNLAIKDGGLEGVKHNLFTWLYKYGKPKMIFISCEWANSFIGADNTDEDLKISYELANNARYFTGRTRLFSMLMDNVDIPIYQIIGPNDEPTILSDSINILELDHSDDTKVAEIVSEGFLEAQKRVSV